MLRLQGKTIYLAALERADCRKLFEDAEYDLNNPTDMMYIGHSVEGSDKWFDEIQNAQGKSHVRLGIFLSDGAAGDRVIGDVALQDIDRQNRSCSIGMGIEKLEYRNCGYGKQAVMLMLEYGFRNIGLERITANTLEMNISAQKSLERTGFILEGRERKAVYFGGRRYDRLNYAILAEDYVKMTGEK